LNHFNPTSKLKLRLKERDTAYVFSYHKFHLKLHLIKLKVEERIKKNVSFNLWCLTLFFEPRINLRNNTLYITCYNIYKKVPLKKIKILEIFQQLYPYLHPFDLGSVLIWLAEVWTHTSLTTGWSFTRTWKITFSFT